MNIDYECFYTMGTFGPGDLMSLKIQLITKSVMSVIVVLLCFAFENIEHFRHISNDIYGNDDGRHDIHVHLSIWRP